MEARKNYYAIAILFFFAGLVFGYITGVQDAQRPPLNPDNFRIPAAELRVTSEAAECSKRSSVPCT